MLSANKEKLHSFFQGTNQYQIPFFQRSYVWKKDNWEELWDNILEEKQAHTLGQDSEHFIGTIIIKQKLSETLGINPFDLIDGQQRLTTICILLKAIQDSLQNDANKNFINSLLIFVDANGKQHIRVAHSKIDTKYFTEIVLSQDANKKLTYDDYKDDIADKLNNIQKCYMYFKSKTKSLDQTELMSIANIVLQKLPVIHMALSKEDDVQQIFDTINSLGIKLTTGELLKNYLFASKKVEPYYNSYWESIFEEDEDDVKFWNENKTAGRIPRTVIELFLHSFLTIKTEKLSKLESLFKEYKAYLKDTTDDDKIAFAKELKEYAEIYCNFPSDINLKEFAFNDFEKRFFYLIDKLDINTVMPLVLYIYKNITDTNERKNIIETLESYLVRRTACKLTTKNYNNLFVSIMGEMKRNKVTTQEAFKQILLGYKDDTNIMPNDILLATAFSSSHIINKYAEGILFCITLYLNSHKYMDNNMLNNDNLSLEHIMPKKWRNHWNTPKVTDDTIRDHKLLTLGNLTVVKGKLNSSMRDAAWAKKQKALQQFSTFKITTDYVNTSTWSESSINNRTADLLTYSKEIWKP
ncbi:DUF262 domain-containing HNH endonuclease family protein [Flavobacterium amniphilum]|uniref:DUF262 domain-containing protein n=1 Tax=Flavobacterium amniphilum TaxID=1834035 RepID=UPI002029E8F5|nr:DUF262 domain-containing protein [Flavobacterium amniphilum]MCL9805879.1 DUF262 domain-containing HNH endonuclease family protein [Flavobacterium amniphilum]